MFFSASTALTGLAAGLLALGGVRADSFNVTSDPICDFSKGPFQNNDTFGAWSLSSQWTTEFCLGKWQDGIIVTGIEVWANSYHVSGFQFTYSDSTQSQLIGSNSFGVGKNTSPPSSDQVSDKHDILKWTSDDQISKFVLSTSSDKNALGRIDIELTNGKKLSVGEDTGHKGINSVQIDVGSGVLLGAHGHETSFISWFTPLMLGNADGNAVITEMKFDQDLDAINRQRAGIQQLVLADVFLQNNDVPPANVSDKSLDTGWTFAGSTTLTKEQSTTVTNTNTFGLKISTSFDVKVGLPGLFSIDTKNTIEASYQYSTATARATSEKNDYGVQWNMANGYTGNLIHPGWAMHCNASIVQGSYSSDYVSTVAMTVKGKPFSFHQNGTFKSTSYTNVYQQCRQVLISDIPTGANITSAQSSSSSSSTSGGGSPITVNNNKEKRDPVRAIAFEA